MDNNISLQQEHQIILPLPKKEALIPKALFSLLYLN